MNIELGKLADGNPVIVADRAFPHRILRVEFYRDQNLLMLVYDTPDEESSLMHYELASPVAADIDGKAIVMIVDRTPDGKLCSYDTPLICI